LPARQNRADDAKRRAPILFASTDAGTGIYPRRKKKNAACDLSITDGVPL